MMLISILYQLLLIIGDPNLLGGFKLGDEFLDMSGLGAIFLGTAQMQPSYWIISMNAY